MSNEVSVGSEPVAALEEGMISEINPHSSSTEDRPERLVVSDPRRRLKNRNIELSEIYTSYNYWSEIINSYWIAPTVEECVRNNLFDKKIKKRQLGVFINDCCRVGKYYFYWITDGRSKIYFQTSVDVSKTIDILYEDYYGISNSTGIIILFDEYEIKLLKLPELQPQMTLVLKCNSNDFVVAEYDELTDIKIYSRLKWLKWCEFQPKINKLLRTRLKLNITIPENQKRNWQDLPLEIPHESSNDEDIPEQHGINLPGPSTRVENEICDGDNLNLTDVSKSSQNKTNEEVNQTETVLRSEIHTEESQIESITEQRDINLPGPSTRIEYETCGNNDLNRNNISVSARNATNEEINRTPTLLRSEIVKEKSQDNENIVIPEPTKRLIDLKRKATSFSDSELECPNRRQRNSQASLDLELECPKKRRRNSQASFDSELEFSPVLTSTAMQLISLTPSENVEREKANFDKQEKTEENYFNFVFSENEIIQETNVDNEIKILVSPQLKKFASPKQIPAESPEKKINEIQDVDFNSEVKRAPSRRAKFLAKHLLADDKCKTGNPFEPTCAQKENCENEITFTPTKVLLNPNSNTVDFNYPGDCGEPYFEYILDPNVSEKLCNLLINLKKSENDTDRENFLKILSRVFSESIK